MADGGMVGVDGDFRARGRFHSPLVVLRLPLIMTFPSFMMSTWYLENSAIQSLSHSWPMEMRDPVRLSKM
jgi:hypothetical protein